MERRIITVCGMVQGVGFRPFVYRLASALHLSGSARNHTGSVRIDVEGESASLDLFLEELIRCAPPLARIDQLSWERERVAGASQFRIEPSRRDASTVFVSPDVATCDACLAELFDPSDRRWRYPFLNCTNCGPRLTIITGAPYDRSQTTMATFPMCRPCRAEYDAPDNRRFHAEPIACPDCGPHLQAFVGNQPHGAARGEPLATLVRALKSGQIGALKGLGGYHLVCDARNAAAVGLLRRRKQRDQKPLAVMVRDLEGALELCEANRLERELLLSPRRPIVLLLKRPTAAVAHGVAPGNPQLGIMLPSTPLHHLLLHDMEGTPLVMTSGNRSDEPIAYEDDDALERLQGIADIFLTHDRPIRVRCDDSVTRVVDREELPVRRSRGYAPEPISLPFACTRPTLAVGGQLKATFALGRDQHAFLSHHLGDLDHLAAYRALLRDLALFEELLAVRPQRIVHDLHPDYASTRYAIQRAAAEGLDLLAVQHHHAHLASCMAEHGLQEPVIGVTFDGTGYGTDGAVWGGEFLVGDYRQFRRAAQLRYVAMPGGEQAIREPWRMALAHLTDADIAYPTFTSRLSSSQLHIIRQMLQRRLNTPRTSSAGRLFDAVAALLGVRERINYEGQAAIELEWLASEVENDAVYPFRMEEEPSREENEPLLVVDTRPLIAAVVEDVSGGTDRRLVARRFHSTVAEIVVSVCRRIRQRTGRRKVVLSGGVFLNALLTQQTVERLGRERFQVFRHRRVPPNDGGLSLGQLAIAAAHDTYAQ